jgi:hypothetical protein
MNRKRMLAKKRERKGESFMKRLISKGSIF